MKLKRFITVFMMIAVLAGCSVTVYAYSVGEGRVKDRYQFTGNKAELVAVAYITESGGGKNMIGCTAEIVGDERDAVGAFVFKFYAQYDMFYFGYLGSNLMGIHYGEYYFNKTKEGYFDRGSTSIEKKDGGQIFVEARSYVDLY